MSTSQRYDATVVGSGFAGSLLARILVTEGWNVLLVERRQHPRFAIGESSTPLANLALERLGRRYGFADLIDLAAHGRWLGAYPQVGRGLKRGFSFYQHQQSQPYAPRPGNTNRLLVAASPNDFVADTHWLRSDVDQFFFDRAREAGVTTLESTELDRVEVDGERVRLSGVQTGERLEIETSLVIDGSGEGGFLRRHLPIETGPPLRTSSSLLFGHFRDVPLLEEVVVGEADWSAPYPEDWAAVHHLLDEGWIYLLRFDDGLVSAGALVEDPGESSDSTDPPRRWNELLGRYPTLEALFRGARVERPVASAPVQRRLRHAHGPRWVVLPHTYGFVDPLFSTGIAWSLLGVERLADSLSRVDPGAPAVSTGQVFGRYADLLAAEIEQVDRLIFAAYRARGDFETFAAQAMLYFALVGFEESQQRLGDLMAPWWRGFLGADDAGMRAAFEEALERVERATREGSTGGAAFGAWIREAIEPWNVAGLAEPSRLNLYPVDFDDLLAAAGKLGLSPRAIRAALPRLRGATTR